MFSGSEASHVLTVSEMPTHKHNGNPPVEWCGFDASNDTAGSNGWDKGMGISIGDNPAWHGLEWRFTTAHTGDSQAHNNLPPYCALYKIMKL